MTRVRVAIKYKERKKEVEFPQFDFRTLDTHLELLCTSKELGLAVYGDWEWYCLMLNGHPLKPEVRDVVLCDLIMRDLTPGTGFQGGG